MSIGSPSCSTGAFLVGSEVRCQEIAALFRPHNFRGHLRSASDVPEDQAVEKGRAARRNRLNCRFGPFAPWSSRQVAGQAHVWSIAALGEELFSVFYRRGSTRSSLTRGSQRRLSSRWCTGVCSLRTVLLDRSLRAPTSLLTS